MSDHAPDSSSRRPPPLPRVAFQGALGAYSEIAIRDGWPGGAEALPHPTFRDTVASVLDGRADFGVIPVENAIAGRVSVALEALAEAGDRLVHGSELRIPINLSLLAPPGATIDSIQRVWSHPMALAQCRIFLARHGGMAPEPHEDTAGAAEEVASIGDVALGAIASEAAASRYGLVVLARNIQDAVMNWTRFIVISRRDA